MSDDVAMAGLRAQVQGTLGVFGAVGLAVAQFTQPDFELLTFLLSVMSCLLSGVYVLWRGARMGDLTFLGIVLADEALMMLYLRHIIAIGLGDEVEMALLSPTILCAVFCGRRWQVGVQLAWVLGEASWLSWLRLGGNGQATSAIIANSFTFVVITVVVRMLRDMAHVALKTANDALDTVQEALAKAERGEVTDPLTGLANRRGLERFGKVRWLDQAIRHEPIALLILDIDHFKRVNDTQGHAAGDELIREVAAILIASVRQDDDVVVRLGGEEFLLLIRAPAGEAGQQAERLRRKIETQLLPITVSIGVFLVVPEVSDELPGSLWRAVDTADRALYEAKRAGRNRVVVAAAEPSHQLPGSAHRGDSGDHRAGDDGPAGRYAESGEATAGIQTGEY